LFIVFLKESHPLDFSFLKDEWMGGYIYIYIYIYRERERERERERVILTSACGVGSSMGEHIGIG
jgi:hypothetical protein